MLVRTEIRLLVQLLWNGKDNNQNVKFRWIRKMVLTISYEHLASLNIGGKPKNWTKWVLQIFYHGYIFVAKKESNK